MKRFEGKLSISQGKQELATTCMGKTLRVLKLAVIRYPNALGGFSFHWSSELVFPYAFLTWKISIIFQVVVVGGFHSITPSLPVRHLKTRGELPYEKARNARWII